MSILWDNYFCNVMILTLIQKPQKTSVACFLFSCDNDTYYLIITRKKKICDHCVSACRHKTHVLKHVNVLVPSPDEMHWPAAAHSCADGCSCSRTNFLLKCPWLNRKLFMTDSISRISMIKVINYKLISSSGV